MTEQIPSLNSEEAIALGSKLAIFISSMPIDDVAKQSLIDSTLLLSPEELVELVATLEVKYAESQVQDLKIKFEQDLLDIKNKFAEKRAKLNEETMSALADFENELDNL